MHPKIFITSIRIAGLSVFFLLTSACALLSTDTSEVKDSYLTPDQILQQFNQHTQQLNEFNNWIITGRIGVKGSKGAFTGSFNWVQLHDTFSITVNGPLGQGTTTIQGNSLEVTLKNGKTGEISRGNPYTLMNQALGWSLPMQDIKQWIKGHPGDEMAKLKVTKNNRTLFDNKTPTSTSTEINLNSENTLALLEQGEWRFEYNKYKPYDNSVYNVSLPHKIIASKTNLTLTFIIKNWLKPTP